MPFDGSGVFNLAQPPFVGGTPADPVPVNLDLADIASGLTGVVTKDGQTTPTANLPMGGNKHTNVANAVLRAEYASAGQIQDGVLHVLSSVAGTNAITASSTPAITAHVYGQRFLFKPANSNTAAVAIVIGGLVSKAITKRGAVALSAGDLLVDVVAEMIYDGTQYQLLNPATVLTTSQVQDGVFSVLSSVAGTNAITASATPAITANVYGQRFFFKPVATNTAAVAIVVNGLPSKAITKNGVTPLLSGDLILDNVHEIVYDGTQYQLLNPGVSLPDTALLSWGATAPHENLAMTRPSVTTMNTTADRLIVTSAVGRKVVLGSINVTANLATSGANGLDAGSETGSTWYHKWVIWNGTTVAGLLSLSSTNPTMPSGYTHKGYVGANFNDAALNLIPVYQSGLHARRADLNLLAEGTSTTKVQVPVTSAVPPNAKSISLDLFIFDSVPSLNTFGGYLSPENSATWEQAYVSAAGPATALKGSGTTAEFVFLPASHALWYSVDATGRLNITATGWRL